jgi:hypothetical protein
LAESNEPAHVGEDVFDILPVGDHGGRAPEDALLPLDERTLKDVFYVDEESDGKCDREELMEEENRAESAYEFSQTACPDALTESQRKAGGSETEKSAEENRVHGALRSGEACEVAVSGCLLGCGGSGGLDRIRHGGLLQPTSS